MNPDEEFSIPRHFGGIGEVGRIVLVNLVSGFAVILTAAQTGADKDLLLSARVDGITKV